MCQCLKFVYFFPVQDVTVLVQLQGSTSSGRRTSAPVPECPAPETHAGVGELQLGGLFCQLQKLLREEEEEVSGGVFNSGGFSRRRTLGEGRSIRLDNYNEGPGAGVVINGLS